MNIDEMKLPVTSELEELVLGELLSYSSASDIETVAEILKEDMFSNENAKKMWKALQDESRKGLAPDSVTIAQVVGMEYVAKVMTATVAEGVSPLNALRHAAALEKLPIYLIDAATTIEDIIYYILTLNHRRKCDIAFIDYLGLIPVKVEKGKTMAQAIGEVTRSLKCMAMQLNIPIVLMCQLNRDAAKEDRVPELTDLRDSGSIEQDADKVIMIQKGEDYVDLAIRKNRQGPGGDIAVKLVSDSFYCIFSEA